LLFLKSLFRAFLEVFLLASGYTEVDCYECEIL